VHAIITDIRKFKNNPIQDYELEEMYRESVHEVRLIHWTVPFFDWTMKILSCSQRVTHVWSFRAESRFRLNLRISNFT
jgi:hypothetical protein